MAKISMIGLDLAKNVFQIHGIDAAFEGANSEVAGSSAPSTPSTIARLQPAQVLSCLIDPSEVTGLVSNANISGSSIKFLIDNVHLQSAAWSCEANYFANNPQADL